MQQKQKINFRKLIVLTAPVVLALVLFSCAHIVKPNGGEKDSEGPYVIGTIPTPRTLNFIEREVIFYFNEFLKPGNYRKEVFISPVPDKDPEIFIKGKRLFVRFTSELRDSTTYVVTLGKGIKDFNEGNKMEAPFVYAFSTGDKLDTMEVKGRVVNTWAGGGEKEMTVLLYPEDDIVGNDIFDQRPIYAATTDDKGEFKFQYLREARYKIYAVKDADKSYSYSSLSEKIALTEDPLVDLVDTTTRNRYIEMYSFFEDKEAPGVKSVRWSNPYTIHVQFTEAIRDTFGDENLIVLATDTQGVSTVPFTNFRFAYRNKQHLYLHAPKPKDEAMDLVFTRVMDTLGTYSDTTLRLYPDMISKKDQDRWFEAPIVTHPEDPVLIPSFFLLPNDIDTSFVSLVDSNGLDVDIVAESENFMLRVYVEETPLPGAEHTLRIMPGIALPDGSRLDTLTEFKIKFPDGEAYGAVSGKIVPDSTRPDANWVMLVIGQDPAGATGGKGKAATIILDRIIGRQSFSYPHLAPGSYQIKLIKDDDGNGYLSPGSLDPYFLPEEVNSDNENMAVRAKWDVEDFNVFTAKSQGNKLKKGKGGDNEDSEADKDSEEDN